MTCMSRGNIVVSERSQAQGPHIAQLHLCELLRTANLQKQKVDERQPRAGAGGGGGCCSRTASERMTWQSHSWSLLATQAFPRDRGEVPPGN